MLSNKLQPKYSNGKIKHVLIKNIILIFSTKFDWNIFVTYTIYPNKPRAENHKIIFFRREKKYETNYALLKTTVDVSWFVNLTKWNWNIT